MRPTRTFTSRYKDKRVKRPDFPLAEAVAWFLEDARSDVVVTTWNTYRSHLNAFTRWLPERDRILASIEPETVERFVRATGENVNTAQQSDRCEELRDVSGEETHLVRRDG